MSVTRYYTATTLDGFIADPNHSLDWLFTRRQDKDGPMNYGEFIAGVGALAMGSTTYEWILDHEFRDKDRSEWKWPYEMSTWVFTHRELPVVPVTLGAGSPLFPRRQELQLEEVARNGDFTCVRFSVVR